MLRRYGNQRAMRCGEPSPVLVDQNGTSQSATRPGAGVTMRGGWSDQIPRVSYTALPARSSIGTDLNMS